MLSAERRVGRPPTTDKVKALVIRLVLENNWGYGKIKGELLKRDIKLNLTTVGNILRDKGYRSRPCSSQFHWLEETDEPLSRADVGL
jgi:hypothetical protein